jgi:hypothetical protein
MVGQDVLQLAWVRPKTGRESFLYLVCSVLPLLFDANPFLILHATPGSRCN